MYWTPECSDDPNNDICYGSLNIIYILYQTKLRFTKTWDIAYRAWTDVIDKVITYNEIIR